MTNFPFLIDALQPVQFKHVLADERKETREQDEEDRSLTKIWRRTKKQEREK